MTIIKTQIVQTGTNATTEVLIPTNIVVNGKAGWSITTFRVWVISVLVAAAGQELKVQLNTETGIQAFTDKDLVSQVVTRVIGTAAGAGVFNTISGIAVPFLENRLTVAPNLYVNVSSVGLLAAATIGVEIQYDIVKLTDLEVMTLLQGGA
jgi:hypothetical protein